MPWLPLAILLVATLTIAALALILFPPGEGGSQAVEDDIIGEGEEEGAGDDLEDEAGDDLSPPPAVGDPPLRGEGEENLSESETSAGPARRSDASPGT